MGPYNDSRRFPAFRGGPALIPAGRQAVYDINNRSDILPDFTLKLLEGESGCNFIDKTFVNFTHLAFHHILHPRIVGMVGPACTASAMALGNLMDHPELNIMQLSIASSPAINSSSFRNAFRTTGSTSVYVNAYSELIRKANWSLVGAIYDSSRPYLSSTYELFVDKVGEGVVKFTFTLGLELQTLMANVEQSCVRVVFVFVAQEDARNVLCSAFKYDLIYPNVQFLFMERTAEDFTEKEVRLSKDQTCSVSDMEKALNGVILIEDVPFREDMYTTLTEAGISYVDFNTTYWSYFERYVDEIGINPADIPLIGFRYAASYYDAVWALALALNKTALQHDLSRTKPKDFGDDMRRNLELLQFEGMSGRVKFDPFRRDVPVARAVLNQSIRSDNGNEVHMTGHFVYNATCSLNFNGTTIPYRYVDKFYEIPLALGISVIVIAMVMTVLLTLLQIAFCKYSHVQAVKATSPHLSHLIFSGCYLLIVVLLVFTVREMFSGYFSDHPVAYGVMCSTMYWAYALGFTLVFGTVASTTWRIYRIFSHFKQGRVRFVADEVLLLFISCLISIDVAMLTSWNSHDPWQMAFRVVSKEVTVRNEQLFCNCNHFAEWITALFLYKGALVALLVILSIFVRRVKKKSFKSTKRVIVLIYILVIDFFIGFTLYAVFMFTIPILSFISLSICLMIAVVIIAFSLFLSPVIVGRFLPEATKSFSSEYSKHVPVSPRPSLRRNSSLYNDLHRRHNGYYNDYYKKVTSPRQVTSPSQGMYRMLSTSSVTQPGVHKVSSTSTVPLGMHRMSPTTKGKYRISSISSVTQPGMPSSCTVTPTSTVASLNQELSQVALTNRVRPLKLTPQTLGTGSRAMSTSSKPHDMTSPIMMKVTSTTRVRPCGEATSPTQEINGVTPTSTSKVRPTW
jgi:gamma-aminobutyric acid type B receptor